MSQFRLAIVSAGVIVALAIGVGYASGQARALTIAVSGPPYVEWGKTARLAGSVQPAQAGVKLVVEQRFGKKWVAVERKTTNSSGAFSATVRPRNIGVAHYRVVAGSGASQTSASRSVPVRVLTWQWLADFPAVDSEPGGVTENHSDSINGKIYGHTPDMHGDCGGSGDGWFDWNLGRRYERFQATVGIRDDGQTGATAQFWLLADGAPLAHGNLTLGMTVPIDVSVHGAFRVRLQINTPDPCAIVAWGNARILGPPPPK